MFEKYYENLEASLRTLTLCDFHIGGDCQDLDRLLYRVNFLLFYMPVELYDLSHFSIFAPLLPIFLYLQFLTRHVSKYSYGRK
jgi:hypothetical protein